MATKIFQLFQDFLKVLTQFTLDVMIAQLMSIPGLNSLQHNLIPNFNDPEKEAFSHHVFNLVKDKNNYFS